MPPPEQDIDIFQSLIGQALIGIVQGGKRYLHVLVDVKKALDGSVKSVMKEPRKS